MLGVAAAPCPGACGIRSFRLGASIDRRSRSIRRRSGRSRRSRVLAFFHQGERRVRQSFAISGWINALFPYIQTKKGLHFNRYVRDWERGRDQREPEGPCDFEFGHGLSRAPFNWQFLGREIPMESLGGFVGVSQDAQTTALRPAIGWALREAAG